MQSNLFTKELAKKSPTGSFGLGSGKIHQVNWLALAVGAMAISFTTEIVFRRRALGNFFGLWVPSLLLIGVYNKLTKLEANVERSLLH